MTNKKFNELFEGPQETRIRVNTKRNGFSKVSARSDRGNCLK